MSNNWQSDRITISIFTSSFYVISTQLTSHSLLFNTIWFIVATVKPSIRKMSKCYQIISSPRSYGPIQQALHIQQCAHWLICTVHFDITFAVCIDQRPLRLSYTIYACNCYDTLSSQAEYVLGGFNYISWY